MTRQNRSKCCNRVRSSIILTAAVSPNYRISEEDRLLHSIFLGRQYSRLLVSPYRAQLTIGFLGGRIDFFALTAFRELEKTAGRYVFRNRHVELDKTCGSPFRK
jgi:hypothetical protein